MEIIAVLLVGRVNAVIDRDKTNAIGGKYLPEITASLDVLLVRAGQVFDNDTFNFTSKNIPDHSRNAGQSKRLPLKPLSADVKHGTKIKCK